MQDREPVLCSFQLLLNCATWHMESLRKEKALEELRFTFLLLFVSTDKGNRELALSGLKGMEV